jgi:tRNA A37 threonylcarbamoyladenosine synthetase subunit TsaC/SUA5/YrdC
LESSSEVPKIVGQKKNQVGIRVPNHNVPRAIVKELGNPILTTSIKDEDEIVQYMTDPSLINDKYGHVVDMVIDSGYGGNVPSTVVLCQQDGSMEVVREGLGNLELYL